MSTTTTEPIPRRLIRVWLGSQEIDPRFEEWWEQFRDLHPGWETLTLSDEDSNLVPESLADIYARCSTYASRSDILRLCALLELGGIYVDVDVMPLRPFDVLLDDHRPFAGMRSPRSFESAVIGCPPGHPAMRDLLASLPSWYLEQDGKAASVQTGPMFLSAGWFGRGDVRHLPTVLFYPYDGYMAPKREEKDLMFEEGNFPPQMLAAHYSNRRWGGKPSD